MSTTISVLVKHKLYPRKLHLSDGRVWMELSQLDKRLLDRGFYLSDPPELTENEKVLIDLDELVLDIAPSHSPAGFIFHLGRCGSTLVVNMLNALDNYQVISEAIVFHELANAQTYKPLNDHLERRRKIIDLFCLLGESDGCRTIFKMASWEVRVRDQYSSIYPDVEACLIVRNIVEIMVAVIDDPPPRLQRNRIRKRLIVEKDQGKNELSRFLGETFGADIDYLANQSYVDFIGNAMLTILNDIKNSRLPYFIIDHKEIVRRVPTELCHLFGIHPDAHQTECMLERARYNSKVGHLEYEFSDDSSRKMSEATPSIHQWCENYLQLVLDEIRINNLSHQDFTVIS